MSETVVLGMSGGVDSSVSAFLLREMGYKVIGVTFKLWEDGLSEAHDQRLRQNINDAKAVAYKLSIEHRVLDFSKEFRETVMDYFIKEYCEGRTPNPCVECNKGIKFGLLLDYALNVGADRIATGHYAKIEYDSVIKRYMLNKSNAEGKDQTYFLYKLSQQQLSRIIFPLHSLVKTEVRRIAHEQGLIVATKKDSQEICFIPNDDYKSFLKRKEVLNPIGNFEDMKGTVIGEHNGLSNYTIGQRKGLGMAFGRPMYVISIDKARNVVVLGDNEDLFVDEIIAKETNFIPFEELLDKMDVVAKIRYNSKEVKASIYPISDKRVKIMFKEKVRAVTPGQSVVFYDDKFILGGGIIE